jgi:hypothetical protein
VIVFLLFACALIGTLAGRTVCAKLRAAGFNL